MLLRILLLVSLRNLILLVNSNAGLRGLLRLRSLGCLGRVGVAVGSLIF